MIKLVRNSFTAIALGLINISNAQADDVEFKLQEVARGLHVLFGQGGNIAISSGSDGVYIVDDQFAKLSEQIKAKIKTIQPNAPEFVINTHMATIQEATKISHKQAAMLSRITMYISG